MGNKVAPAVLGTVDALRVFTAQARARGQKIALVPTMGALHEGHLTLVREGLKKADCVMASIFVNPMQFGPKEDLAAYPRTLEADLEKLAGAGAKAVYCPAVVQMYPEGFATKITLGGVAGPLEGACRPGHFDGVATVVAKLFLQCTPDIALFGEKDWQQLAVIRRMVADLDMPVEICGVETVRDQNGLALSSRNAYLSAQQYEVAYSLNKTLFAMAEKIREGEEIVAVQTWGKAELEKAGFDSADYLEVRDAATLDTPGTAPLRILAAVRLGKARLIDNVPV